MINDKHGTRQEYLGNKDNGQELVEWASTVANEWTWLFKRSAVTSFADPADFTRTLLSPAIIASGNSGSSGSGGRSSDFNSGNSGNNDSDSSSSSDMLWIVLLTDGVDCQPCKTAKTNLMRVSAGLYGLPARVGLVDCTHPAMAEFCYSPSDGACLRAASSSSSSSSSSSGAPTKEGTAKEEEDWVGAAMAALPCHALPEVPHAPVLKAFVVRKLQVDEEEQEEQGSMEVEKIAAQLARGLQGEVLYNNNEVRVLMPNANSCILMFLLTFFLCSHGLSLSFRHDFSSELASFYYFLNPRAARLSRIWRCSSSRRLLVWPWHL